MLELIDWLLEGLFATFPPDVDDEDVDENKFTKLLVVFWPKVNGLVELVNWLLVLTELVVCLLDAHFFAGGAKCKFCEFIICGGVDIDVDGSIEYCW